MTLSSPRSTASWRIWPTSVMFFTAVTSLPKSASVRRSQSARRYERRFPRWTERYTVGPHVYMRTSPGRSVVSGTAVRWSVYKMRSCTDSPASTQAYDLLTPARGALAEHPFHDPDSPFQGGAVGGSQPAYEPLEGLDAHRAAARERAQPFRGRPDPHDPAVVRVVLAARHAGALHLLHEAAHRGQADLLGAGELAEPPRPAHEHRKSRQLRRRHARQRVGAAGTAQEVDRRGMEPVGEVLRRRAGCVRGHAVILVSIAKYFLKGGARSMGSELFAAIKDGDRGAVD